MMSGVFQRVLRQRHAVREVWRAGGRVLYSEWSPGWLSRALAWLGIGMVSDVVYDEPTGVVEDELFRVLCDLPFLKILVLRGARVDEGGLQHLPALAHLCFLDLGKAKGVTDRATQFISGCSTLTTLFLDRTSVTDKGLPALAKVSRLTQLYLDQTAVSDDGLECLRGMKQLTALWLRETEVSEAGFERLREALPHCSIVWRRKRTEAG
jgi:hypothetical protein